MSGYITYVKYSASTEKGQTHAGDVFNTPFALGKVDANYTSQAVVENIAAGQEKFAWTACVKHVFQIPKTGTMVDAIDADVKLTRIPSGETTAVTYYGTFAANAEKDGTFAGMTFVDASGMPVTTGVAAGDKVAYKYDNIVVPQNDLPRIKAEMKSIPLVAKARRVAIFYSQIAAFQAKTDYGFDLGDQLAE